MRIELRITSGARAGQRETFDRSLIALGRHPLNDLRFDADRDLDVSGRHAEIRVVDGTALLRDVGSSNGTTVNGQPLTGERALFSGDVIQLGGVSGAGLEFHLLDQLVAPPSRGAADPVPANDPSLVSTARPRRDTTARIAEAVEAQTGKLRRVMIGFGALVVLIGLGLAWQARRNAAADRATIDTLLKQLQDQNTAIAALKGSGAAGLSDEVSRIRHERDSLLTALRSGASTQGISSRIAELDQRQMAAGVVSRVDYEKISEASTPAVAFIVVQHAGNIEGGTGFGLTRNGILATNKHVVQDENGAVPEKIAVQFHGTKKWVPAHVIKVSSTDDLAFLKIDVPGNYPVVQGLASSGGVKAGAPIAVVGYPLGNETAGMGGSIDTLTARASLAAGFVSKNVPDILQVDAYVAHGSSGSPVFNQKGLVVGVVYGGPAEAAGRIVYSVPSDRVIAQLPGEAASVVKQ